LEYNWYEGISGQAIQVFSNNVTIIENSFINNEAGIFSFESKIVDISTNSFIENNWGIISEETINITVTNNYFFDNYNGGLFFYLNSLEIITENTFISDGINLNNVPDTFYNNTVNGKPIGLFNNQDYLNISQPLYGQLLFFDCSDLIVQNQDLSNTLTGLYLDTSHRVQIRNNTCNFNSYCGILNSQSMNSQFINNTCLNNSVGIRLVNSDSCDIINNSLTFNDNGLIFLTSNNAYISNNNISFNTDTGIYVTSSNGLEVEYNFIRRNTGFGIIFYSSDNNNIHHNSFYCNAIDRESQALDNGESNLFYHFDLMEGNFWNDWSGVGPYSIYGDAENYDYYPLTIPPV
jgi:parallel beta-helix repeat protein